MSQRPRNAVATDIEFGHERATHHRFAIILAWWLAATTILLALMGVDATRGVIEDVDRWWLDVMRDAEVEALVRVGEAFSFLGGVYVALPLRVVASLWLVRLAQWERAAVWITAVVFSEIGLSVLKALYGRTRPPDPLEVTASSSFPSGHTVATTAMMVALIYIFSRPGKAARHWFYGAGAFAVAMALSRTYLRAHWLSDVVVGLAIGTVAALAAVWLVERFTEGMAGSLRRWLGWLSAGGTAGQ